MIKCETWLFYIKVTIETSDWFQFEYIRKHTHTHLRLVRTLKSDVAAPVTQFKCVCVCVRERERAREWTWRSQSFASLPSMLSRDKVNKQCRVEGQGSLTLKTKHHPHQTPCLRNKENKPAAGPRSTDIRALLSSTLTTKKKPSRSSAKKCQVCDLFPQTRKQLSTFFRHRKALKAHACWTRI